MILKLLNELNKIFIHLNCAMQRIVYCLFIYLIATSAVYGQPAINYGNNACSRKILQYPCINMYCEIYGSGKPLLVIHGNGGSISSFTSNIPYFAKKYKVIAVDSRSHGKSVDPKDSLSFEMMADDFAVLLDTLQIRSAYVLGWSDGGINALLLAMRHPEKVIKLASTGANLSARFNSTYSIFMERNERVL
jgi:pimeloyl-ACP methyl ester carboxylesterase